MARFLAAEAFSSPSDELSLLPFNFERTGTEQFLVSNMVGDFIRLTEDEINKLIDLKLKPGDGLYEKAYAAHLITGSRQNALRYALCCTLGLHQKLQRRAVGSREIFHSSTTSP